jgi:predicted metalloprotease
MLVSSTRRVGGFLGLLVVLFVLSSAATASAAPNPISPFLDDTLSSVDTYWHQTDAAEGRPAPSVQHAWVAPGARVNTGCGDAADDKAAFYCPTDDTIYVGQAFASQLYDGVVNGLPGERAGYGRAAGAFAVGYVIAHEYGHNVQQELGELSGRSSTRRWRSATSSTRTPTTTGRRSSAATLSRPGWTAASRRPATST